MRLAGKPCWDIPSSIMRLDVNTAAVAFELVIWGSTVAVKQGLRPRLVQDTVSVDPMGTCTYCRWHVGTESSRSMSSNPARGLSAMVEWRGCCDGRMAMRSDRPFGRVEIVSQVPRLVASVHLNGRRDVNKEPTSFSP